MDQIDPPADLKERLRTSYNSIADKYNKWTEPHDNLRNKYLDLLFKEAPKLVDPEAQPRVVELGAGAGVPTSSILLGRNPSLTLVANDLSDAQLDLAKKNLATWADRVELVQGDMTSVLDSKVAPGSLTAVVAMFSIIHLPQEEQRSMVRKLTTWLEPGGCLLANFPGGNEPRRGIVMKKWMADDDWMFWSALGVEGTVKALQEAGLEVVVKQDEMEDTNAFLWIIAKKV